MSEGRDPRGMAHTTDDLADARDLDRELAEALRAAIAPSEIDPALNEALLARALRADAFAGSEPVDEPASDEELLAAERLRSMLDHELTISEHRPVITALRLANRPSELDAGRNELLVARALSSAARPGAARRPSSRNELPTRSPRARGVLVRLLPVAAAAAAALTIWQLRAPSSGLMERADRRPIAEAKLIEARSASALFAADGPFPVQGGETARIDRVAAARASDLRANRFARWGAR